MTTPSYQNPMCPQPGDDDDYNPGHGQDDCDNGDDCEPADDCYAGDGGSLIDLSFLNNNQGDVGNISLLNNLLAGGESGGGGVNVSLPVVGDLLGGDGGSLSVVGDILGGADDSLVGSITGEVFGGGDGLLGGIDLSNVSEIVSDTLCLGDVLNV